MNQIDHGGKTSGTFTVSPFCIMESRFLSRTASALPRGTQMIEDSRKILKLSSKMDFKMPSS